MPMSLLAIVLFFVYTYGLGFSLTRLVKESEGFLERSIMRIGIGLSAFILLGIVLSAFRIPVDYRIFLAASVAVPLYFFIFKKGYKQLKAPRLSLRLTASRLSAIAALLIFAASLFMYSSGAFRYPYLEDDDPWGHASAAKYVSTEKAVLDPLPFLNFQYMDPYPPGYDMLFGVLNQASQSVMWTLKFFNALIIALSILFFYFFAKEFTGSSGKALFATFVLASVPAYLSHFIWAPALAMAVFMPLMYAFEMVKRDKLWWAVASVCFASVLLTHPTHAAKLSAMLFIYLGIKVFSGFVADRKLWLRQNIGYLAAVAGGVVLSMFWWAFKLKDFASLVKGGFRGGADAAAEAVRNSGNIVTKILALIPRALNAEGGTATRVYSFQDFVVVHSQNMINNPVGFGIAASLLVFAGVVAAARFAAGVPRPRLFVPAVFLLSFVITFLPLRLSLLQLVLALFLAAFVVVLVSAVRSGKSLWLAVTLGWLLFAFLGVNSKTFDLPIGLFAFRFWMVLAVPVAIIAAEGLFALLNGVNMLRLDKATATAAKLIIIIVVVAGMLLTSAKQKYDINTACWPAGAFWSGNLVLEPESSCPVQSEVVAYNWLKTLPKGTKVFTFSGPDQVIAYGAFTCGWCEPEYSMKKRFAGITAAELYDFMKSNGYGYVVVGGIEARGFGINDTVRLVNDLAASSDLFSVAYNGESAIFFRAK